LEPAKGQLDNQSPFSEAEHLHCLWKIRQRILSEYTREYMDQSQKTRVGVSRWDILLRNAAIIYILIFMCSYSGTYLKPDGMMGKHQMLDLSIKGQAIEMSINGSVVLIQPRVF
jgi:hypothetical protein